MQILCLHTAIRRAHINQFLQCFMHVTSWRLHTIASCATTKCCFDFSIRWKCNLHTLMHCAACFKMLCFVKQIAKFYTLKHIPEAWRHDVHFTITIIPSHLNVLNLDWQPRWFIYLKDGERFDAIKMQVFSQLLRKCFTGSSKLWLRPPKSTIYGGSK